MGFCIWSAIVWAVEPRFNDSVPDRYVVKKGDTLWDISEMYLRDPWLWPEIWAVNPQIANPHLIYPGDVLTLVYVDGKQRLRLERGRDVKLSPQVKVTEHREAIPALPLEAVNSFLSRTRVVQPGELEAAPYVVAGIERRVLSAEGDDFYARGTFESDVDFYGIYRKGDPYIDDATGEVLGIKAEDIGSGQLKQKDGDISTFLSTRSEREIRVGDRLLPTEERRLESVFYPKSPDGDIRGKIIDVEGGVTQVGTLNVVAINRGEREGLAIGDVLAIYKKGEQVKDRLKGDMITLPSERAGLMMVFRTYEKMSFGLVLTASSPLAVGDEIRTP